MNPERPLSEEEIRQRVREAMQRQRAQREEPKPEPTGMLLPILRSASSSEEIPFLPHTPVVPEQLFVTLAHVAMTPQGTIGMNHLTRHELGDQDFDALLSEATANLMRGITAQFMGSDETPDRMVSLEREGYFAASAVVAPDFHEWLSGLLDERRLLVALPCPDQIYVTGADSQWGDKFAEMVLSSEYEPNPLTPCLLLADESGIELVVEQPRA
ncbi:hypothetical protein [Allokutzneria oryzae]|uniref:Uncharacterized protein n=1 Tax=Allokutzneria oryzae TaxID=1378989 RepID=A0ABV6A1G7_9PSEU